MKIVNYSKEYAQAIYETLNQDDYWNKYCLNNNFEYYKVLLNDSYTIVLLNDENEFIGYARSIIDGEFFVIISDLYIKKTYRHHNYGQLLIKHISKAYINHTIYVLSEIDQYYEKNGYQKEGSIYKIK